MHHSTKMHFESLNHCGKNCGIFFILQLMVVRHVGFKKFNISSANGVTRESYVILSNFVAADRTIKQ